VRAKREPPRCVGPWRAYGGGMDTADIKQASETFATQRKQLRDLFLSKHTTLVKRLWDLYKDEVTSRIMDYVKGYEQSFDVIFIEPEEIDFRSTVYNDYNKGIRCYVTLLWLCSSGTLTSTFDFWFCGLNEAKNGLEMFFNKETDSEFFELFKTLDEAANALIENRIVAVTVHPELKGEIYFD
jgi:hypothetical protein